MYCRGDNDSGPLCCSSGSNGGKDAINSHQADAVRERKRESERERERERERALSGRTTVYINYLTMIRSCYAAINAGNLVSMHFQNDGILYFRDSDQNVLLYK